MHRTPKKAPARSVPIVLAVVIFTVLLVYLGISLIAHDLYWFQPGFNVLPDRVVVYQEGQVISYQSGQSGYQELAIGIQSSLARGVAGPSGSQLNQKDLDTAYFNNVTVEAYFDAPVKLHAWFDTGYPTQMLFPITGTFSGSNLVFLGLNGTYPLSTLSLKTLAPLDDALSKLGYPVSFLPSTIRK